MSIFVSERVSFTVWDVSPTTATWALLTSGENRNTQGYVDETLTPFEPHTDNHRPYMFIMRLRHTECVYLTTTVTVQLSMYLFGIAWYAKQLRRALYNALRAVSQAHSRCRIAASIWRRVISSISALGCTTLYWDVRYRHRPCYLINCDMDSALRSM